MNKPFFRFDLQRFALSSLEEALKTLEGLENGKDLVTTIQGEFSRRNKELKALRDKLKTTEDSTTAIKENYTKILSHLGIEEEENLDLDSALESLKDNFKQEKGNSPELEELQKKFNQMNRELQKIQKDKLDLEKLAQEEKAKRHNLIKREKTFSALVEGKAIKPEFITSVLSSKVKVNEDDSLVFLTDDGQELEVREGVKSFLENNPEFVINAQQSGSGSSGNGGKESDLEKMSMADYIKYRNENKQ